MDSRGKITRFKRWPAILVVMSTSLILLAFQNCEKGFTGASGIPDGIQLGSPGDFNGAKSDPIYPSSGQGELAEGGGGTDGYGGKVYAEIKQDCAPGENINTLIEYDAEVSEYVLLRKDCMKISPVIVASDKVFLSGSGESLYLSNLQISAARVDRNKFLTDSLATYSGIPQEPDISVTRAPPTAIYPYVLACKNNLGFAAKVYLASEKCTSSQSLARVQFSFPPLSSDTSGATGVIAESLFACVPNTSLVTTVLSSANQQPIGEVNLATANLDGDPLKGLIGQMSFEPAIKAQYDSKFSMNLNYDKLTCFISPNGDYTP